MVVALNAADEREAVTKTRPRSPRHERRDGDEELVRARAPRGAVEEPRPRRRRRRRRKPAAAPRGSCACSGRAVEPPNKPTAPSVREVDEAQIEHDAKRNGGIPIRARSLPPPTLRGVGKIGPPLRTCGRPSPRAAPASGSSARGEPLTFRGRGCRAGIRGNDGVHRATVGMVAGCLVWRRARRARGFRPNRTTRNRREGFMKEGRARLHARGSSPVTPCSAARRSAYRERRRRGRGHRHATRCSTSAAAGKCRRRGDARDAKKEKWTATKIASRQGCRRARPERLACLERYCWLLLAAYCGDCGSAGFDTVRGVDEVEVVTRPKTATWLA